MAQYEFRVATEFNVIKVKVTTEVQDKVDELVLRNCCIGCEQLVVDGDRKRRGLCSTCYQGVINALRKRRVTEKELMERGRLLPKSPGGRKPANAFTASLAAKPGEAK